MPNPDQTYTFDIDQMVDRTAEAAERISSFVPETPLDYAPQISHSIGVDVRLKDETATAVRSFKVRGALNNMLEIQERDPDSLSNGVLAASAGNHAQGVAYAAGFLNIEAKIVMPRTTPLVKIRAVEQLGGKVILEGDSYSDAYDHSQSLVKDAGLPFIHPFNDANTIIGQATIAKELLGYNQSHGLTDVFVPVGGGGLLAGMAAYLKQRRPDIRVVGVEPEDSSAMKQSLEAGYPVTLDHVGTFADGVAVKRVGDRTFSMVRKYADELITVDNDMIAAAIEAYYDETRRILEPAGALAIAGITSFAQQERFGYDATAVAVCSGANMSFSRLEHIAARSEIGRQRQGLFVIELPERPGALLQLCEEVMNGHSITEFRYRKSQAEQARFMVGVEFMAGATRESFADSLKSHRFGFHDVSHDPFTESGYGSQLMSSGNPIHRDERFFHLEFPERPGALTGFLKQVGERWNISLFQYKNTGGDRGKVLIGFENPDPIALEEVLRSFTKWHQPVAHSTMQLYTN